MAEFQAWHSGSMRSLLDLWLETTMSLRKEMDTLIANEKKSVVAAAAAAARASRNKTAADIVAPSQARQGASANALGRVVSTATSGHAPATVSCVFVRVRARAFASVVTMDRHADESEYF